MRKLKLDSLQVESFETVAPPQARGTVQAHEETEDSLCYCSTMDFQICPYTQYIDCTYGCTYYSDCPVSEGKECYTQDPNACPYTEYLDCSMGCTDFKTCAGRC